MMLAMTYVLVLAIVALEIPLALTLRQRIQEEVRLQARNSADVVAVLAGPAIERGDTGELRSLVAGPAREARGRIVVVDGEGEVVADSASGATIGSSLATRPEVRAALRGKSVQLARSSTTLGMKLLATAVPVRGRVRVTGAVRVTQDVAAETAAYRRALAGLVLVGFAVLGAGLLAGAVIARQFARPLRRFEEAALAVAEGDLGARAPVEGSSEQQALARAFNAMTDRLAGSLQTQSQFVADASHQLRTPLTGLRLRLEEASARNADPAVDEQIGHGIDEVDRLARTVEELLVLSQTGERDARAEDIDLTTLAVAAAARWRPYAEAHKQALNVEDGGRCVVHASRADLDRVIDALIENALHYSPDGTTVTICTDSRELTVRDHGPGLAAGEGEELFERFHRGRAGSAHPESTGLGLAIARELARRWHGDVTLAAAEGGGTLARVSFAGAHAHAHPKAMAR